MKTEWHNVIGFVEYAQVFEQNRDKGTGGENANVDKARKKTDGLYKVHFYPADQEAFEKMKGVLSDPMFQGYPRWHKGDENLGVGQYTKLTRKHKDPSGIEDFGGAPKVFHGPDDRKGDAWDYGTDGPLGNGTKVRITFTTYGEGESQTVRLTKIGVLEHVEYQPEGDS